jgi:hypothetical protein
MKILTPIRHANNRGQKREAVREIEKTLGDYLSIKELFYKLIFNNDLVDYNLAYNECLRLNQLVIESHKERRLFCFTTVNEYWFRDAFAPIEKPYSRTFVSMLRLRQMYYGEEGLSNRMGGSF